MEYTTDTSTAEETSSIQKAIEQIADKEAADSKTDNYGQPGENPSKEAVPPAQRALVHHWFFTFMCMNIPVIGWFYLLYLAFNKKYQDRQSFARAYLFYKLIFLIIGIIILAILIHIGMELLDELLAYMEML